MGQETPPLKTLGYVANDGGTYGLGFRLLELGGRVAKPELERLVETTGELASVNVEERGRFIILHTEYGAESLPLGIYPALSIPTLPER